MNFWIIYQYDNYTVIYFNRQFIDAPYTSLKNKTPASKLWSRRKKTNVDIGQCWQAWGLSYIAIKTTGVRSMRPTYLSSIICEYIEVYVKICDTVAWYSIALV